MNRFENELRYCIIAIMMQTQKCIEFWHKEDSAIRDDLNIEITNASDIIINLVDKLDIRTIDKSRNAITIDKIRKFSMTIGDISRFSLLGEECFKVMANAEIIFTLLEYIKKYLLTTVDRENIKNEYNMLYKIWSHYYGVMLNEIL
ncbi:MAG: hypothetical protein ACRC23_01690 [Aeromonas jandaei]